MKTIHKYWNKTWVDADRSTAWDGWKITYGSVWSTSWIAARKSLDSDFTDALVFAHRIARGTAGSATRIVIPIESLNNTGYVWQM